MNKISDYVFRQLFPDFDLRPVNHVLFPSYPFFLKADLEEKDGIFTFFMKVSDSEPISVRFRLCYKIDRVSLASNVLVAYLQLIDRDLDTIDKILRSGIKMVRNDDEVYFGYKELSLSHECDLLLRGGGNSELQELLRIRGFHELYSPLLEKLKDTPITEIKHLSIIEVYGFHETIRRIQATVPCLGEGEGFRRLVNAIRITDPEDQSSSYSFINKIFNPNIVHK